MPIVRTTDSGQPMVRKLARRMGVVYGATTALGLIMYTLGYHMEAQFIVLCSCSMSSIHNLVDDHMS